MEDLIYCYWDEFPRVAEPPNTPPTEAGAVRHTDTNRLCYEVLAPLVGVQL